MNMLYLHGVMHHVYLASNINHQWSYIGMTALYTLLSSLISTVWPGFILILYKSIHSYLGIQYRFRATYTYLFSITASWHHFFFCYIFKGTLSWNIREVTIDRPSFKSILLEGFFYSHSVRILKCKRILQLRKLKNKGIVWHLRGYHFDITKSQPFTEWFFLYGNWTSIVIFWKDNLSFDAAHPSYYFVR